ncbi:pentapeptide repeat-containing protein [Rhodococcus cerastii]|nr:pentapeptide repeat-containing protein [Rhodococcus cerastii]
MGQADLAGVILRHANLTRANLTRANLGESNRAYADLRDVRLRSSVLNDANLADAALTRTDLSPCAPPGAEFARANLKNASLHSVYAPGTGFAVANLTGANIEGWRINFFTVVRGARWTDGRVCKFPSQAPATDSPANLPSWSPKVDWPEIGFPGRSRISGRTRQSCSGWTKKCSSRNRRSRRRRPCGTSTASR